MSLGARHVVVLVLLVTAAGGFNLAPNYATVFGDPQRRGGSYFGYSVSLVTRDAATAWVIVGAPRANSSSHAHLIEPGVTYKCSLTRGGECTPITLDTSGNVSPPRPSEWAFKHKKDHAWIGGAIDVHDDSDGGRILVCGHRWKNQLHKEFYLMNGICYVKYFPFDAPENAEPVMPLIHSRKQGYLVPVTANTTEEIFFYAYGEAGLSVHFTTKGEMLIGAPGVKQWAGTVIRYKNVELPDEDEISSRNGYKQEITIPNPLKTPQLTDFGHFGYSVDSGRFLKSTQKTQYVGGAPRAGSLKGKVYVFDFPKIDDAELNIMAELEGFQMGEYFGASVCVVDLNADGLDDLVVGAPQHSLDVEVSARLTGDEGRVYVFINEDLGILSEISSKNVISGAQAQGARFGTAIAKIGDLNKDGYNDIAVGAPYEESGRGAIYIYHGRSSGIHHKYSQRITAAEIHTSLSGFGISISKGVDIDGNHYNDLAIGAFNSGHAVIIPSQAVVSVRTRLSSDVTSLGLNATGFSAIACISYSGKHAPPTAGLLVALEVASHNEKAQFVPSGGSGNSGTTYQYYRLLNQNKEHCDKVPVEIRKTGTEDFTRPIELNLQFELDHRHQIYAPVLGKEKNVGFCSNCPVVDPTHKTRSYWNLPYAADCGEDDICRTDLSVKVNLIDSRHPFVLGAQPKLGLKVLVSNRGEQAFLVKLNVSVPRETPLTRLPSICQEVTSSEEAGPTELECDMGSVLAAGAQEEFILEVEMRGLSSKVKMLEYTFNVSSVGEEQHREDNVYTLSLPVQIVPDVSIQGKSSQDKGNYSKHNQTFYHTFEIRNYGPSPADVLKLMFYIPIAPKTLDGNKKFVKVFRPSAYFDNQPITCTPVNGHRFDVEDVDNDNEAIEEELPDRRKRSVAAVLLSSDDKSNVYLDSSAHSDTSKLPANRTLIINCTDPEIECMEITCDAGPFKTTQNRAVVSFRLVADFYKIEPHAGKRDIVVISSHGEVRILNLPAAVQPTDGRPDETSINSVFFLSLPQETVGSHVLALSIAVGVLILFVIIGALAKTGFFLRSKRNELNELKEENEERLVGVDNESEDDLQNVHLENTVQTAQS